MIVRKSQHSNNNIFSIKLSKTPTYSKKDYSKASNLYKTLLKSNQKINKMLQINKKFQKQFINSEILKMKDSQRYSLKKIKKYSLDRSQDLLSPLKLKCQSPSKQKIVNLKQGYLLSPIRFHQLPFTLLGQKFIHQRFVKNQSSLIEIPSQNIQLSKLLEDSIIKNQQNCLIGFWISQNKYVSLFPINHRKIDKIIVINQPQILPLLGCLVTKNQFGMTQKYIVTDFYDKKTLKHLLKQFGILQELTLKHYLRKIILGIWNLHKNRIYHNRLSLDSIIYTQQGQILINMIKSSTRSLSQKEKYQKTHIFPPEMLLSKSNNNSEKNDIWAIGCIALELITNSNLQNNFYHPYNKNIQKSTIQEPSQELKIQKNIKFLNSCSGSQLHNQKQWMKDSIKILQKVQKLIEIEKNQQDQGIVFIDLCQSMYMKDISPLALDFIDKCLNIKLHKRPSIDELMFHPFLKL